MFHCARIGIENIEGGSRNVVVEKRKLGNEVSSTRDRNALFFLAIDFICFKTDIISFYNDLSIEL
jgi:hypothetical protein